MAQVAAEELKIPLEKINVPWDSDTAFTPYDWQTVASRGAFMGGRAVIAAAQDALRQIKQDRQPGPALFRSKTWSAKTKRSPWSTIRTSAWLIPIW